ncbi:MAG: hypothetical protein AB7T06_14645 [Kofleriaceae bacterium]
MRNLSSVLLVASVLGACGDDGNSPEPMIDAPPALRYPISFEVRGDVPLLLASRDDDGTWTAIAATDLNEYMFEATNRHAIAMVCGDVVTGFRTDVVLRTRFDADPFFFCSNTGGLPPQRFELTGEMMQPGEVHMEATDAGTTSPWTFELSVSGGTHDLIAYGDSAVLLQRNLSVTANATLPAIDLAQAGVAYETTAVLLGNALGDETVETVSTVFTQNDLSDYTRAGTTVYSLPASLLAANDFQFAEIRATTPTTSRSASIDIGGATPMITLMPRLEGITFTEHGASWTALPASTARIRTITGGAKNYASVEATGGYLAGDTEVAVMLDIPGFDDAWRVTDALGRLFVAYDDEFSDTTYSEPLTAARRVLAAEATRRQMDRARRARSGAGAAARARR